MSRPDAGLLREALFNGNGVARRLIVALVLFSAMVTSVITALELYSDYRRDREQIDRALAFVTRSYMPVLADSVWVADREQVQTQLDGLLRLPDVEFIGIVVDGALRWSAGRAESRRTVETIADLTHEHRGQDQVIGKLHVVASVDRVLVRLWGQLLSVVASSAVKTFLVAGFMLVVFQFLVTRHLTRIAGYVRAIDPTQPPRDELQLARAPGGRWRPDILDVLSSSINALTRSLREAVQALRRNEEHLRALTRETTAFIFELDHDGRITFANRAYTLPPEQVVGTLVTDWVGAVDAPALRGAVAGAFGGRPQRLEYAVCDRLGRWTTHVASIDPIVREGGVASAVLTSVDISERKTAEQAIRELNASLEARVQARTAELQQAMLRAESASRAKSEFLSRMSHELRTPMNAVLGFAQLIELSDPNARQLKWAGEIRRAGEHLLRMIEDLLDLARIEIGKLSTRVQPLDLQPVLDEAVSIVQPMLEARGLRLQQEGGPAERVLADRLRLRQVLVNLLSNAVKYNRPGGEVRLRLLRQAGRVRVVVADTGIGIASEHLTRLFQPFDRLGAEHGHVEGTGIGLALSHQLAGLMGATLGVESVPGNGSAFWIDLQPAESAAPPPEPSRAQTRTGELHVDVLYVEDKASNAELVATYLHRVADMRVRTAPDGGEGLAAARARRPDVMLLDIHLPGTDGYEVLKTLRADPEMAGLPVIALSADAMPHDIERGLAAGFDAYLAKPVELEQLLVKIEQLARTHRDRLAQASGGAAQQP